jgi:hypothetical protein
MLISVSEVSESSSILDRPYIGIVTNNNDPLKQGRVKCTIKGLIEDATNAPWILRSSTSFLGGTTESGQFAVPEVGAELRIEFPYRDIYAAEYTGYWNGSKTTPSKAEEGYPNTVVLTQIGELSVTYEKTSQKLEVTHPSGTVITVKQNGDVEIVATKDITLNGSTGKVLTTESEQVIDHISGAPCIGVMRVKAGMV